MNEETLKELLANARSAPWTFGESQSPDGQEWMGCGIAASGHEFIWFEDDPDTDIPTARLIALAPQLAADNIALQAEVERLRHLALEATHQWKSWIRSEYEGCRDYLDMVAEANAHFEKIQNTAAVLPG